MERLPESSRRTSTESGINSPSEDSWDPIDVTAEMDLHRCAKNGCYNEMKELLSHEELDINGVPETEAACQGLSALHLAVRNNHLKCVELLLTRGADVNQVDNFGFRPVHDACMQGNLEALQLLLQHGAIVDGTAKDGLRHITPTLCAARHGHLSCLKLLAKRFGISSTVLWDTASKRGNTKILELLPTSSVPNGLLPSLIHNSALGGQTDFLYRILRATNFELPNDLATAAFLTAAQHGHTNFLVILIENGVDPNVCDKNKVTALHNAARFGQIECIMELVQSGANTEALTDERWTPLHVAVRQCQEEAVGILIEMGASIESIGGPLDETPLHLAVNIGDIPVLKTLMQGNPSLLAQNKNGKTVLQLQLRESVKSLLIKHAKS